MNDPTTWLFVPGSRPDRYAKACGAAPDAVILDLEDSVTPEQKDEARRSVASWLTAGGVGWVRVNAVGSPWLDQDLLTLRDAEGLQGIVVPKVCGRDDVETVAGTTRASIIALIETARGISSVAEVCSAPSTARVAFGAQDFALDVGASDDDEAMLYARSSIVVASRAAGLPAPVDGVTVSLDDVDRVATEAARSRRLGFGGKLCIHPAQVDVVAEAFDPTPAEIDWARRIVEASGGRPGAGRTAAGDMFDEPILRRAHLVQKRAAAAADRRGRKTT